MLGPRRRQSPLRPTQTLALAKFHRWRPDRVSAGIYLRGCESAVADPEKELVFDLGCFLLDRYLSAGLLRILRWTRFGALSSTIEWIFRTAHWPPTASLEWTTKATKKGSGPPRLVEGRLESRSKFDLKARSFEPIKARFGRIQWTVEPIGDSACYDGGDAVLRERVSSRK